MRGRRASAATRQRAASPAPPPWLPSPWQAPGDTLLPVLELLLAQEEGTRWVSLSAVASPQPPARPALAPRWPTQARNRAVVAQATAAVCSHKHSVPAHSQLLKRPPFPPPLALRRCSCASPATCARPGAQCPWKCCWPTPPSPNLPWRSEPGGWGGGAGGGRRRCCAAQQQRWVKAWESAARSACSAQQASMVRRCSPPGGRPLTVLRSDTLPPLQLPRDRPAAGGGAAPRRPCQG